MTAFKKFSSWIKGKIKDIKERAIVGKNWIGTDGLINMESSTILTLFLMTFLPIPVAMILSAMAIVAKSIIDKNRGHNREMHDLICAIIGVVIGAILGIGLITAAIVL